MKILYLSTIIGTINSFFIPHIKVLQENDHIVDIAGNITSTLSTKLKSVVKTIWNLPLERNPLSFNNLTALRKLIKIIKLNKYDIVHVHTPVASVIGRLGCIITKTKCFYTAHGFHFYKGAPLLNWLIYFPIEWFLSFFTDTIICINKEDFELAKKYFHANKTEYIPGVGINIDKFANVKIDREQKRKELGIPNNCKLLLSVGELNNNKNHQVVLKALAELKNSNIHYAICGNGNLYNYLLNLAKHLNVDKQFHLLGSRSDVPEVLKCADIFIHPSLREGLPVSVMEAMASGLPCIVSNIRGNVDLIQNKVNGFIANDYLPTTYAKLIIELLEDKAKKGLSSSQIIEFSKKFGIENVVSLISKLYENIY